MTLHSNPNPFERPAPSGWGIAYIQTCGADDRIRMLKTFTVEQLCQVVELDGVQKTVRLAAERRLRTLEGEAKSKL